MPLVDACEVSGSSLLVSNSQLLETYGRDVVLPCDLTTVISSHSLFRSLDRVALSWSDEDYRSAIRKIAKAAIFDYLNTLSNYHLLGSPLIATLRTDFEVCKTRYHSRIRQRWKGNFTPKSYRQLPLNHDFVSSTITLFLSEILRREKTKRVLQVFWGSTRGYVEYELIWGKRFGKITFEETYDSWMIEIKSRGLDSEVFCFED